MSMALAGLRLPGLPRDVASPGKEVGAGVAPRKRMPREVRRSDQAIAVQSGNDADRRRPSSCPPVADGGGCGPTPAARPGRCFEPPLLLGRRWVCQVCGLGSSPWAFTGPVCDDIDVVWFDKANASVTADQALEARLREVEPLITWSGKNQARMHTPNGDAPYRSTEDAISRWPETATAVGLRLSGATIEIISPHGLHDLFSLVLRPTPSFNGSKLPIFRERILSKRWLERWPRLTVLDA